MKQPKISKSATGTILTCLATIGVVAASVMAVKATPKALSRVKEAEKEKGSELSKWETVKVAAPQYIPVVLTGTTTIACIWGANILSKRQQASLSSAYAFLDQSYKKYRRKVVEFYGEEAHNKIVNSIAVEESKEVYPFAECMFSNCKQYLDEDYSEPILFYDEQGHRYFNAPLEQVLMAEYYLNRDYVMGGVVLLNNFYEFLGLEPTEYGQINGWCGGDGFAWIDFNHKKITMDDGLECYIIEPMWMSDYDTMIEDWL